MSLAIINSTHTTLRFPSPKGRNTTQGYGSPAPCLVPVLIRPDAGSSAKTFAIRRQRGNPPASCVENSTRSAHSPLLSANGERDERDDSKPQCSLLISQWSRTRLPETFRPHSLCRTHFNLDPLRTSADQPITDPAYCHARGRALVVVRPWFRAGQVRWDVHSADYPADKTRVEGATSSTPPRSPADDGGRAPRGVLHARSRGLP